MAYYVYLLASRKHGTLYIGVTSDLIRRVHEHKTKAVVGFTSKYEVTRLVWFEAHHDVTAAIVREKEIKKWRREWKLNHGPRDAGHPRPVPGQALLARATTASLRGRRSSPDRSQAEARPGLAHRML